MNPLAPIDPKWKALEHWLNHGEGAQLTDKELIERMRCPDGLKKLADELMGKARK